MIPITDYLEDQMQELQAEKESVQDYVANQKPYWLSLRHPRDGEMQWDLWNYAPLAHYDIAIEETRELLDGEVRTDGGYADLHDGTRRATVYYWLDPETGAALYHTGVNDEETVPFFPDEDSARHYLEKRAENGDKEAYQGLSLYKARVRKVGDAVDVLTDQSGIGDFVPDGGRPDDLDELPDPQLDQGYSGYDLSDNNLLQDVAGGDVSTSPDRTDRYLGRYGALDAPLLHRSPKGGGLYGYNQIHVPNQSGGGKSVLGMDTNVFRTGPTEGTEDG